MFRYKIAPLLADDPVTLGNLRNVNRNMQNCVDESYQSCYEIHKQQVKEKQDSIRSAYKAYADILNTEFQESDDPYTNLVNNMDHYLDSIEKSRLDDKLSDLICNTEQNLIWYETLVYGIDEDLHDS